MLRIKKARLEKRWTQTKLAGKADLSAADVSRIENGRFTPYPGQLERLAKVLKLEPDELLQPVNERA